MRSFTGISKCTVVGARMRIVSPVLPLGSPQLGLVSLNSPRHRPVDTRTGHCLQWHRYSYHIVAFDELGTGACAGSPQCLCLYQ